MFDYLNENMVSEERNGGHSIKEKWSFNKAVEKDIRLKKGKGWGGQDEDSGQTPII